MQEIIEQVTKALQSDLYAHEVIAHLVENEGWDQKAAYELVIGISHTLGAQNRKVA